MIVGAVAVPSAAQAIAFQCGSWEVNGSFQFRACIDDTPQGDMWHEIQIQNRSTSSKSLTYGIYQYVKGLNYPCGTYSATIGAGQTYKRYCVSVRYVNSYYMTTAKTTVSGSTVHVASPLVYT
ncbi:hypothetical protein [Asanoa ishikariensis]|nr:hypothetical protein [Asanoa ishikariensis]